MAHTDLIDRQMITGQVAPAFENVRREFERNFQQRGETGAAVTVFHRGEKVVDLWGGYQCLKTRTPWNQQTLSLSFSVTKGMAAAAMAVAHSRGLFHLDGAVADYWPEFGCRGKDQITVRQLLDHQAGLITIDQALDAEILADHDRLSAILARQTPQWSPGSKHGYHTVTLGWYQNELIRRVDPQHRSLGAFFQDEIATPLEVEFYIGLPPSVDPSRVSTIQGFHRVAMLGHLNELPPMMVLAGIWPRSLVSKSIRALPVNNPAEIGESPYREVEIPSANGIGQSVAIAKIYDVLARGGAELGITANTWHEIVAPAVAPHGQTYDAILKLDTNYGFGFSRPSRDFQFGSDSGSFGCPGAGGSLGIGDPSAQMGFAYLTNKMGFRIFDDPRERAVRNACYECLAALSPSRRAAA
ncbi:beta-lactamase family protein [Stieleria sp. TO1_6]|uniref:serine hydrolase domain-containing protein n=1 Tax=Stieleria tagensis TaxID=2956795 RepID=UPI00209BAE38|nr:serine hydrolase domain-containing protein [Stieleria tagensis]MCO8122304.1 beta-lactamase family protein [Stieleria tagensis]